MLMVMGCLAMATVKAADADKKTYAKAEIYYVGWTIMPRTRLTLTGIRNSSHIKTTVNDDFEVKHLVQEWLRLDELKKLSSPVHEDPRLVVDLFDESGKRTTYYASSASLISEDGQRKRSIDRAFRDKFHFAAE